ncbi:MAG TPA: glycosyltransferase family 9 protein [Anaerolineales bacterium]|nr:glycosyltransferase family 9 protein [Anaerolineales bacterium]
MPLKVGQSKNVLILRALPWSDVLTAVPAFRALRSALPDARITLISLPSTSDFVKRFPGYIDDFIPFPGFPGFSGQPANVRLFPSFLNTLQKLDFDLALQMHGPGGIENSLISLCGARASAGFCLPGSYCPDERLFLPYPEQEPEIWRHLRLMEFLGIPLRGDHLEFPLFASDWSGLQKVKEIFNLYRDYVCIHPGVPQLEDRWNAKKIAGIADGLAAFGYQIVLTGGPQDADFAETVAGEMENRPINLAGALELGRLAALVSKARLVVSNDTGTSNIAAALRTPSIVLFSSLDTERLLRENCDLHQVVKNTPALTSSQVLIQAIKHLEKLHAFA